MTEREFFIDNLLVRIHFIIVMLSWTGLARWEFEFPFPGSLTCTFLRQVDVLLVEGTSALVRRSVGVRERERGREGERGNEATNVMGVPRCLEKSLDLCTVGSTV